MPPTSGGRLRVTSRMRCREPSLIALVGERGDLLGDQPDQKHDHRGGEQQHAHVAEVVCRDKRVNVITEAAREKCAAGRREQFSGAYSVAILKMISRNRTPSRSGRMWLRPTRCAALIGM